MSDTIASSLSTEYLSKFEEKVLRNIISICSESNLLDGGTLYVEELDDKWKEIAPEYFVDAIPQIKDYPEVSLIWAAYAGMGVAALWDKDWNKYKDNPNLYREMERVRGFDYMDEYICEILLGMDLKSQNFKLQENVLRKCAMSALNLIRHEGFEPQTIEAFQIYSKVTHAFYIAGISLALKRAGYRYEKMMLGNSVS